MKALNALLATMAAAITLSNPIPAAAQSTYVWTSITYGSPDEPPDSAFLTQEFPDRPSSAALNWSVPGYGVGGSTEAGFGYVRGSASASSSAGGVLGHYLDGSFVDQLMLSNPLLDGREGQLTMSFRYVDMLAPRAAAGGTSNTNVRWYAYGGDAVTQVSEVYNIGGTEPGHTKSLFVSDATGVREGPAGFDDHLLTLTVNFTWGEPIFVGYGLAANGYAEEGAGYTVEHFGGWNGIMGVTADGVVVDDYALASLSGTDYSQAFTSPVPEPGIYLMLGAGLCVFAARRLRQQRSTPAMLAGTPLPG